jgi:hypothetical protein
MAKDKTAKFPVNDGAIGWLSRGSQLPREWPGGRPACKICFWKTFCEVTPYVVYVFSIHGKPLGLWSVQLMSSRRAKRVLHCPSSLPSGVMDVFRQGPSVGLHPCVVPHTKRQGSLEVPPRSEHGFVHLPWSYCVISITIRFAGLPRKRWDGLSVDEPGALAVRMRGVPTPSSSVGEPGALSVITSLSRDGSCYTRV